MAEWRWLADFGLLRLRCLIASAADLKFLHHPLQTPTGTSNRKAALALFVQTMFR
jgi:hypothetical protein